MFGPAGALAGEPETEQFSQVLLSVLAVQVFRADLQLAALAMHEALAQPEFGGTDREIKLDAGRGRWLTPRQKVVNAGGSVALEKCGTDGSNQRAFSGFIGAGKQVQTRLKAGEFEGVAKLPKLFNLEPVQPHAAPPAACRSVRMLVSRPSAWAATSALSPTWPACLSRSSAITLPR